MDRISKGMVDQLDSPYLDYMLERFALRPFEQYCVRALFAFEQTEDLTGSAEGNLQFLTPEILRQQYTYQLADEEFYGTFASEGALLRFFLDCMDYGAGVRFCERRLRLKERVFLFAAGHMERDEDYQGILLPHPLEDALPDWIGEWDSRLDRWWELRLKEEAPAFLYLYGQEGSGKRFCVQWTCRKHGYGCGMILMQNLNRRLYGAGQAERRSWMDGLIRELMLEELVPVLVLDDEADIPKWAHTEEELLERLGMYFPVLFVCATKECHLNVRLQATCLEKRSMTMLESRQFWLEQGKGYPVLEGARIAEMAGRFRLTPGQITKALSNAEQARKQAGEAAVTLDGITAECHRLLGVGMGSKAFHIPARYHMDDLILPELQKQQLRNICAQIRFKYKVYEEWGFEEKLSYGRGISVVFSGTPGTGKTMAAQVMAAETGLELYRVNLSTIISKYIGETEKNLDEIFEQAENSQVILFFDEADVLFGKRTENKEANDKYNNLEAAFLLQRMESYEGITILATNLFHHFDEAFKRRLKAVIEFPMPQAAQRRQLWLSMLPERLPVGEIDLDYLSENFELSGSNIRNILLQGAFLAAARDKVMDMEELIPAIRDEYKKNGKSLSKADVSEYYMYLE